MSRLVTRRGLVAGAALGAGTLLTGCDRVIKLPAARKLLFSGEDAQRVLQRSLMGRDALAREYGPAEMSSIFRSNGTANPDTPDYNALAATNFADYRLRVDGMVARPLAIPLAELRRLPARTQITRHDCVEGWSAIGQWHGPQLGPILKAAGLSGNARYVVFHCADFIGGLPYYESIDMVDAFHPQTILALGMNGAPLTVPHGAPVRLRVERQLGYKHAKYVMRIEAVASLDAIGKGHGGYCEDNGDYDWYAGI